MGREIIACYLLRFDMSEGFAAYGKELEELGKMFQDDKTSIKALMEKCRSLDLVLHFAVSPKEVVREDE